MRRVMLTEGDARPRRRRSVALLASGIVVAALLVCGIAVALPDNDGGTGASSGPQHPAEFASAEVTTPARRRAAHPAPVTQAVLTIGPNASTTPVPASYFGLSTEYWALPLFERNMAVFERVISLLHVPGNGPLRAADRRRLGRPFVLDAEEDEPQDAGVGVCGDADVSVAAANPRQEGPGQVDCRPEPDHGHAAHRCHLGARRRDLASAGKHHRVRGRQRARPVHPLLLGRYDRALAARRPAAADRAHPGQLRRRLLRVRSRARGRRARHPADRARGRTPQAQLEVDQDADCI